MNRFTTALRLPAVVNNALYCVGPESHESVRAVLLAAFESQRPDRFDGTRIPAKVAIAVLTG